MLFPLAPGGGSSFSGVKFVCRSVPVLPQIFYVQGARPPIFSLNVTHHLESCRSLHQFSCARPRISLIFSSLRPFFPPHQLRIIRAHSDFSFFPLFLGLTMLSFSGTDLMIDRTITYSFFFTLPLRSPSSHRRASRRPSRPALKLTRFSVSTSPMSGQPDIYEFVIFPHPSL